MALRLPALERQNSISTSGVGWRPALSSDSGSCFSTFLICFVHVMTAPSSRWTRSWGGRAWGGRADQAATCFLASQATHLGGDSGGGCRVERRQGQAGLAARLADRDGHVCEEAMHAVDDLLGGDLSPAVLVGRVREEGKENIRDDLLEVLQWLGAHLVDQDVL